MSKAIAIALICLLAKGLAPAAAQIHDILPPLTQREILDLWTKIRDRKADALAELNSASAKLSTATDKYGAPWSIPPKALRQFFRILDDNQVPLDKLEPKLERMVLEHVRVQYVLWVLLRDDPGDRMATLWKEACAHIGQGDYAAADTFLAEAETLAREQTARRQLPAFKGASEALGARGYLALARRDYQAAVTHFATKRELVLQEAAASPTDSKSIRPLLDLFDRQSSDASLVAALVAQGGETDDKNALLRAIEIVRPSLPEYGAIGQARLGGALAALGGLDKAREAAWLDDAIAAYRRSLQFDTSPYVEADTILRRSVGDESPGFWPGWRAATRRGFGDALRRRAELNYDPWLLLEAVVAYRLAQEDEFHSGGSAAELQYLIARALVVWGRGEGSAKRLGQAMDAYREALQEWPRERSPLNWAATQRGIGSVLASLDELGTGTDRLERAVAAYRLALEEWTRERAPAMWARIQIDLGAALAMIGERQKSTARLEAAAAAYRLSQQALVRELDELEWERARTGLLRVETLLSNQHR